jgi:raffinose/stachyose/melibiose transport system permease protein
VKRRTKGTPSGTKSRPWRSLIAAAICAVQLVPIYITLTVALKPQTDLSSYWAWPDEPAPSNFLHAIEDGHLLRAGINTFIITAVSTFLVVIIGAMAAYPLARYRSRLNAVVNVFVLSILMIPALSLLVPLYVIFVETRAVSTYHGIILVHLTFNLPLSIFMFSNFIRTIPRELDEAAVLLGCSIYSVFFRVILPLLRPVTVSVVLLTAGVVWNDFQYSLYFLQKPQMQVLTLSIASFFGISGADPHIAAAGALIAIAPMVLVYLLLQKYFVKGMIEGAVKG